MAGANAIRAGLAVVELGADLAPLQAGLSKAADLLGAYAGAVGKAGAGLGLAGAAIAGPLTAVFQQAVAQAAGVAGLATQMGTTAEEASRLTYAMEKFGVSEGEVVQFTRHMNSEIASAADGNIEAIDSFRKLRLSLNDLRDMSPTEQLLAVGGAISGMPAQFDRMTQSTKFFGRAGVASLAAFANGGEALKEKLAEADTIGATVTTEQANQAKEIKRAWGQMQDAVKYAFLEVGRALFPQVDSIKAYAAQIMATARTVRVWIAENKNLILGAMAVGFALVATGAALVMLAATGGLVAAGLSAAAGLVGMAWTAAVGTIGLAYGAIIGGLALIKGAVTALVATISFAFSPMGVAGAAFTATLYGLGYLFVTQTETGKRWGNAVAGAAGTVKSKAIGAFEAVRDVAARAWPAIRDAALDAWSEISAAIRQGDYRAAAMAAFSAIAKVAQAAFGQLDETVQDTLGGLASSLKRGDFAAAAEIAWAAIKAAWAAGVAWIVRKWNDISGPALEAWHRIAGAAADMWADLKQLAEPFVEMAKDLWDDIVAAVVRMKDRALDVWESLSDEWKAVVASLAAPFAALIAPIVAAFDFLKPYLNDLFEGLSDNWGSIFSRLAVTIQRIFLDMSAKVMGKTADMMQALSETRWAKATGQSGLLAEGATALGGKADELSEMSDLLKEGQALKEAARREDQARDRAARDQKKRDEQSYYDAMAGYAAAELAEINAAEKRAAEEHRKRKKEEAEFDAMVGEYDAEEEAWQKKQKDRDGGQAAAREVRGTTGSSLAGSAGYQQALGLGSTKTERDLFTDAEGKKQTELLAGIKKAAEEGGGFG